MSTKRFLIWTAVSSEEQAEKYSPQEQANLAHQHVAKWGGSVVAELSVSESRSIVLFEDACARIPAYAALRDHIAAKTFDVLICYDTTRLGRKTSLILAVLELCAEAGIAVYEIDNPPPDLAGARGYDRQLLDALKAVGSQREVEKLKQRLAYGRIGRVKAGGFPGREPPYGYRYVYAADGARGIETVEEQAAIVREIFAAYLAGRGMNTIAADLQARGVPSPGSHTAAGSWQKTGVWVIIRRAWTYAGVSRLAPKGQLLAEGRGRWEPIIDTEIAERALAEHATRKANRRTANAKSRLTGVVWCEQCGRPMRQVINEDGSIMDAHDKRPGRRPRPRRAQFACAPSHPGGSVGTNRVLAALHLALDALATADLAAIPDDANDRAEQLRQEIAQHESAAARHAQALRRADTAYVNGVMDDARYQEQVRRLQAAAAAEQETIAQLRAQLANAQAHGSRRERLEEIRRAGYEMLTTPDTVAANAWWRRYCLVLVEQNSVVEVRWL
jgi:DNA invertase Pin-like site-specific DNA recombinase